MVQCTDREGDDVTALREQHMVGHMKHIEDIVDHIAMAGPLKDEAGQQIVGAMLNVLRDPDFAAKAQKSMDERESRAREFLSTAEAIDETRKQFLEALEGAAEQSPLVATQMAMKMKIHLQLKIQLEQQQVVALADHLPMQTMQNWKRKLQD